MELTKEQIHYIENRLINDGVSYWDIRLEILDHIVTDVEIRLDQGEYFSEAVQKAMLQLGWNGSFEELTQQRLFGINKIVRKQYFNQAIKLFKNVKTLLLLVFFSVLYFFAFKNFNFTVFKKITLGIILTPVTLYLLMYFYHFFKSKRSAYLIYGSFYVFFSFLILNMFIQLPLPEEGLFPVSQDTYKIILFFVTIINSIFTVSGILVYGKLSKKINTIQKQLLS